MVTLGVPYDAEARNHGVDEARAQARKIADDIAAQGGPTDLADKDVVALIAYLQRLGTDIKARPPTTGRDRPRPRRRPPSPPPEASDMSLSELVSTLTPSSGAQVGVVIFAALFAVICVRLWSRHQKAAFDTAKLLPLADDDPPLRPRGDGRGDVR